MKTEIIASWKLVTKDSRELYVVTTVSGAIVWINKHNFDTNAETITYKLMKAGDEYTKSDKTVGVLKDDRNEFIGCGKQIVKKYSAVELMDHMISKGVTPQFALS